jgi:hypothetical protein
MFSDSSRLYRQAYDSSQLLIDECSRAPFAAAVAYLRSKRLDRLDDQPTRVAAVAASKSYMNATAAAIDPRLAIPVLMEAAERFYYVAPELQDRLPWLGTSLKTAIAVIWPNRSNVSASNKSLGQLLKLVGATALWEQIDHHVDMATALDFGASVVTEDGIQLTRDEDRRTRARWNAYMAPRGQLQRTLEDSKRAIWHDPQSFLEAAAVVLRGAEPSAAPALTGSVFASVGTKREFWLGVSGRLLLLIHLLAVKRQVSDRPAGIVLFEEFGVLTSQLGDDQAQAKAATQQMFWQSDWYARRSGSFLSGMLVERPAIRIDGKTFVASVGNMMDSINAFVEDSVFRDTRYGGVELAETVFREHVSGPFEARAIEVFRNANWLAGSVTESGIWKATNVRLLHTEGSPCPGEIDVLGVHPSGRFAMLVECKVLRQPRAYNTLVNLVRKLGADDSDGFHSKLARKLTWLRSTVEFQDLEVVPVILVDQGAVLARNPPHLVVEFEDLPEVLRLTDVIGA